MSQFVLKGGKDSRLIFNESISLFFVLLNYLCEQLSDTVDLVPRKADHRNAESLFQLSNPCFGFR